MGIFIVNNEKDISFIKTPTQNQTPNACNMTLCATTFICLF